MYTWIEVADSIDYPERVLGIIGFYIVRIYEEVNETLRYIIV